MSTLVDARGLPCPQPVVEARKALEDIEVGQVTVLVDNATSRDNIRRFAEGQGCAVTIREEGDVYYVDITKLASIPEKNTKVNFVVFISTDKLGEGDEHLGQILMKSFLNTLWDSDPRPSTIIFINNGVKLTTSGSEMLDTLKLLQEAGVGILSCGTCLAYYELTDKLEVGVSTNMYEIVNLLINADKVIKI